MKTTILIVDDISSLRTELRVLLEPHFEVVGEAQDGAQAVELAKQFKPKIVLMDVVMPKMSGIEATKEILSKVEGPPKVVMLSGLTDQIVVAQALSAGAEDYLFKPVDAKRLVEVLNSVLNERS